MPRPIPVLALTLVLAAAAMAVLPPTRMHAAMSSLTAAVQPAPPAQEGGGGTPLSDDDWFKRLPVFLGAVMLVAVVDAIVIVKVRRATRAARRRGQRPDPAAGR